MHYVRTSCDKYFLSYDCFSLFLTGRSSATQAILMHFSQSKSTICKSFWNWTWYWNWYWIWTQVKAFSWANNNKKLYIDGHLVCTVGGCGGLERTHWPFIEKTSMKQDPNVKCSYFQMSFLHLSQTDPQLVEHLVAKTGTNLGPVGLISDVTPPVEISGGQD